MKKAILIILAIGLIVGGYAYLNGNLQFNIGEKVKAEEVEITPNVKQTFNYSSQNYELTLIKKWIGESSEVIKFNSVSPPYLLEIGIGQKINNFPEQFFANVYHESNDFGGSNLGQPYTVNKGAQTYLLDKQGNYTIEITSSSFRWYAKIGR